MSISGKLSMTALRIMSGLSSGKARVPSIEDEIRNACMPIFPECKEVYQQQLELIRACTG